MHNGILENSVIFLQTCVTLKTYEDDKNACFIGFCLVCLFVYLACVCLGRVGRCVREWVGFEGM